MRIIKLILVVLAIEEGIATLPVAVPQLSKANDDRHNACSLIFNIATTPKGQQTVTSIKIASIRTILSDEEAKMMGNICNLVFAVQPTVFVEASPITSTILPNKVSSTESPLSVEVTTTPVDASYAESNDSELAKPIYELQLAAWPTEVDDIADAIQIVVPAYEEQEVIFPEEEILLAQAATESGEPTVIPFYEDQLIIFPEINSEEDNLSESDNEDVDVSSDETQDVWPIVPVIHKPVTQKPLNPMVDAVEVVESYHTVHPNGITEYKIALSNGLVECKKIYNKIVDDEKITVQEGFYSIPIVGKINELKIYFYIADENGYNIYKVEHHYKRPDLLTFLSNTEQTEDRS